MGSLVIAIATIPLLGCGLILMRRLEKYGLKFAAIKRKLKTALFWSHPIVLLNESYAMICMCTLINIHHLTYDSKVEVINSLLTFGFIIMCCLMPCVIGAFLLLKFPQLDTKAMQTKYSELTKGLDFEKGRIIALAPVNFLLRRLLLVTAVVFNFKLTT